MSLNARLVGALIGLVGLVSCGVDATAPCGPARALVRRVIDGDTFLLEDGTRVRMILIDAPELDSCFGAESADWLTAVIEGREVELRYDARACEDDYERLLAFVSVEGVDLGRAMVERGLACSFFLPPVGEDLRDAYHAAEAEARLQGRGLFGACERRRCGGLAGSFRSRAVASRLEARRSGGRVGAVVASGTSRGAPRRERAFRPGAGARSLRHERRDGVPR